MEKYEKKHKKRKKEKVSYSGICDAEFGCGNAVIESSERAEKGDVQKRKDDGRRDSRKKNKKREKGVKEYGKVDSLGIKEVTKEGEEAQEPVCAEKPDEDIWEKVERKRNKREKHKTAGESGHQLQELGSEDMEGDYQSTVNESGGSKIQNCRVVETIGMASGVEAAKNVGKKKRKREKRKPEVDFHCSWQDSTNLTKIKTTDNENQNEKGFEILDEGCDGHTIEKSENGRKRKKEKEMNASAAARQGVLVEDWDQGNNSSTMDKKEDRDVKCRNNNGSTRNSISTENSCQDLKVSKSKKKVSFSYRVEVFHLFDDLSTRAGKNEEKLIQGKRFSREEDEIIKKAVYKYIDAVRLGEEGLNMVLNSRGYPKLRNCWKEIGTALPYRPYTAFYKWAQTLFRRSAQCKWTNQDYESLRNFQELYGNQWKILADGLGRYRVHLKDAQRRIRSTKLKKEDWSQKEIQGLYELVNADLLIRFSEEKKSTHGMLRDNISWTAISNKLSTRTDATCCLKWYKQLTSSMVAEGNWTDTDDYRLINSLYQLDASRIEDVNWDNLLDHRSGHVCRKRWSQMVLHIGHHRNKSFSEQVEVLARRYCPDLLEARVGWDSKPIVP